MTVAAASYLKKINIRQGFHEVSACPQIPQSLSNLFILLLQLLLFAEMTFPPSLLWGKPWQPKQILRTWQPPAQGPSQMTSVSFLHSVDFLAFKNTYIPVHSC